MYKVFKHLLLNGINNYRISQHLSKHKSVTAFLNRSLPLYPNIISDDDYDDLCNSVPECIDDKLTAFYQFEKKEEQYLNKEGKECFYSRTSHINKKEPVNVIMMMMLK